MDKFLFFSLSIDDQEFINRYLSPKSQASILKKVAVEDIPRARKILKILGITSRTMYRGPRHYSDYNTRKKDAVYASLYSTRIQY